MDVVAAGNVGADVDKPCCVGGVDSAGRADEEVPNVAGVDPEGDTTTTELDTDEDVVEKRAW